jgi:endonuclease/exonuclease/phosphatase family metal-dependent hydrolase
MKIGTWNVEYGQGTDKNRQRVEIIRKNDCDIWILTETNDALDLSETHISVASQPRDGCESGARWVVIWSRFPVISRLAVVDEQRTAAALLDTPKGPLIVFGTVLPWHSDQGNYRQKTRVRNWSEQYRVLPEQEEEWSGLQKQYPHAALCVAGDLNMSVGGPQFYGTAAGRSLLDKALDRCGLFCSTSFDHIEPGLLRYSPIDHVLLPRAWEPFFSVASAWEGMTPNNLKLSDHSGLAVLVVG